MLGAAPLTRAETAKIAEAAVLLRLVVNRYNAFSPVFDGDRVDWLVEVPQTGRLVKVQVKTVKRARHGLPSVRLNCVEGHNTARRLRDDEFDFIVGYDFFTDIAYVWGNKEVAHLRTTVSITPEAAERWDKLLQPA